MSFWERLWILLWISFLWLLFLDALRAAGKAWRNEPKVMPRKLNGRSTDFWSARFAALFVVVMISVLSIALWDIVSNL